MQTIDQILIDIAPEMASVPEAYRQRLIEYASEQVKFGTPFITKLATAYLVAHMNTMANRNGVGGAVSSEAEGSLSRSFSFGMTGADTSFGLTSYGQEFERLMRMFIFKTFMRTM